MLFNSLEFLLFLPLVTIIYFSLPSKYRWFWLLLSSYYFYMCWNPKYAILIFTSTVITYLSGITIDRINKSTSINQKVKYKNWCVAFSFSINLLILVYFKYFNFFIENINAVVLKYDFGETLPFVDILLPVGISFYTFQALSYTLDVYRGDTETEYHFGRYALFVSFFPQLVAGPIERSSNLLSQFKLKQKFSFNNLSFGAFLILRGLFKKVVIADRLAILVNTIYNNPTNHEGLPLIVATLFFTFQIYCDFSAYSDIAIGTAKIMGFDLMQNFNKPYFAQNVTEFWRKWHISLSTWFKDYLYIPLGGNRVSSFKRLRNIFIVFIVSGLWHGASWNFIIWGGLHGIGLIFEQLSKPLKQFINLKLNIKTNGYSYKLFHIIVTFSFVSLAWVFFRANTLTDAVYILQHMFTINSFELLDTGLSDFDLGFSFFLIMFLITVQIIERKNNLTEIILKENIIPRWITVVTLVLIIIFWGFYPVEPSQFIYFQF
ncbi:MAG: membrane-bound O-acyltransferase family protein [Bacteroidetes bacterium MedPE-SWsnd-G2]|nr:MAG: membrane-bound O-acyltransferase family protein [Bacteroidetes bacterium MedPE-SWsnd-G2]